MRLMEKYKSEHYVIAYSLNGERKECCFRDLKSMTKALSSFIDSDAEYVKCYKYSTIDYEVYNG